VLFYNSSSYYFFLFLLQYFDPFNYLFRFWKGINKYINTHFFPLFQSSAGWQMKLLT
jgi:hypothetical protein